MLENLKLLNIGSLESHEFKWSKMGSEDSHS